MESGYTEYTVIGDTLVTADVINLNEQRPIIVVNPMMVNRSLDLNIGMREEEEEEEAARYGRDVEAGQSDNNDEDNVPHMDYNGYRPRGITTAVIKSVCSGGYVVSEHGDCLSSPNYQPISPADSPLGIAVASTLDDNCCPGSVESIEVENKRPDDYYDDTSQSQQSSPCDPFRPECRIPLPGMVDQYPFMDNRTFVRRRNERERTRVRNVNEGFERLRQHLPLPRSCKDKRLSKVETLREAISYIKHLQNLLKTDSNR